MESANGGAELFDIFLRPAVALHAVIAERRIAAAAELFAHRVAQMHELVVNAVKIFLMVLEPLSFGFPGSQAARVVGVRLERLQLRQRIDAVLEGDLRRGGQLAVFGGELIFFLHVLDDLGGEGLLFDLGVYEEQVAVFGFEILPEGGFEHRIDPRLLGFFQFRPDFVPEFDLFVVEFVAGVDRMAHIGEGAHRTGFLFPLFLFQENGAGFFPACGVFQLFGKRLKLGLHLFGIGSFVGHFGIFHH